MKTAAESANALSQVKNDLMGAVEALKRSGTDDSDFHGAIALRCIAETISFIEKELSRLKALEADAEHDCSLVFNAIIENTKAINVFGATGNSFRSSNS